MSYIMGGIVEHCEKYPSVKEHSRPQALGLLKAVRSELEQTRMLFLKHSDLASVYLVWMPHGKHLVKVGYEPDQAWILQEAVRQEVTYAAPKE